MKNSDVVIGSVYAVKVSGNIVPVRILNKTTRPHYMPGYAGARGTVGEKDAWVGQNLTTGREIRVRSGAKLRYELERDPAMSSRWVPLKKRNVLK